VDPKNPQPNSMMHFVRQYGRAEAIWFPFTENPWLKIWEVTDGECPKGATKVDKALNYPFSDELGDETGDVRIVVHDEDAIGPARMPCHRRRAPAACKFLHITQQKAAVTPGGRQRSQQAPGSPLAHRHGIHHQQLSDLVGCQVALLF